MEWCLINYTQALLCLFPLPKAECLVSIRGTGNVLWHDLSNLRYKLKGWRVWEVQLHILLQLQYQGLQSASVMEHTLSYIIVLIISVEKSPWQTDQPISWSRNSMNPKFQCRVHKNLPLIHFLSQMKLIFTIHIILVTLFTCNGLLFSVVRAEIVFVFFVSPI
jgi:hypothetical protein